MPQPGVDVAKIGNLILTSVGHNGDLDEKDYKQLQFYLKGGEERM